MDPTQELPPEEAGGGFGRYQLRGVLGRGGMGVVYRAYDTQLDRDVALKVMLGGSEDDLARFQREVRSAGQLSHPGIVEVYDVGVEDGRPMSPEQARGRHAEVDERSDMETRNTTCSTSKVRGERYLRRRRRAPR